MRGGAGPSLTAFDVGGGKEFPATRLRGDAVVGRSARTSSPSVARRASAELRADSVPVGCGACAATGLARTDGPPRGRTRPVFKAIILERRRAGRREPALVPLGRHAPATIGRGAALPLGPSGGEPSVVSRNHGGEGRQGEGEPTCVTRCYRLGSAPFLLMAARGNGTNGRRRNHEPWLIGRPTGRGRGTPKGCHSFAARPAETCSPGPDEAANRAARVGAPARIVAGRPEPFRLLSAAARGCPPPPAPGGSRRAGRRRPVG